MVVLRYLFAVSSASVQSASSSPPVTPSLCINNLLCFLTFFPCLSLFFFFFFQKVSQLSVSFFVRCPIPLHVSLHSFLFFMFSSLLCFLPVLLFCIPLSTVLGVAAGMKNMMSWRWRSSLCFCSCSFSVFPWAAASLHRWRRRNCWEENGCCCCGVRWRLVLREAAGSWGRIWWCWEEAGDASRWSGRWRCTSKRWRERAEREVTLLLFPSVFLLYLPFSLIQNFPPLLVFQPSLPFSKTLLLFSKTLLLLSNFPALSPFQKTLPPLLQLR